MNDTWLDRHRARLDGAVAACASREYFSAFDASPSRRVYGAEAAERGKAAFEALLHHDFPLRTPGADATVVSERSPYGIDLGVGYPRVLDVQALLEAATAGMHRWRAAGPAARVGVCLEILDRLHARIFELAYAVQFTSGQGFLMAFRAGGAQALNRALETVAFAWVEMTWTPERVLWEKPDRRGTIRMEHTFTPVPRGISLVVGSNTFPTWTSWTGLFASLSTGNSVVVKPHPNAVLPLAITVQVCQEVLAEAGFDPNLVLLAAEDPGDRLVERLALRSEVRIIDFTGDLAFGDWLETRARQALVFTDKSGLNTIVVDSTHDFDGMCHNLARSFAIYSGQIRTAPQNVYIPADGIDTDQGHRSLEEVVAGIAAAFDEMFADDAQAVELLGCIISDEVLARLDRAGTTGEVLVPSRRIAAPGYPGARVRTPVLVRLDVADRKIYETDALGPIGYVIATADTEESLALFGDTLADGGAMTAGVYSTSESVLAEMRELSLETGVALSENLVGALVVNETTAFSDFLGTGAGPAANASYTDGSFVASRFRVVQSRRELHAG
jgi:phenylacetic acid degradation protein paaN